MACNRSKMVFAASSKAQPVPDCDTLPPAGRYTHAGNVGGIEVAARARHLVDVRERDELALLGPHTEVKMRESRAAAAALRVIQVE